jgi:hypothetical protein
MPTELSNHTEEGFVFDEVPASNITVGHYDRLHEECLTLVKNSVERRPWRLYVHEPYDYWVKGKACILGDAAHPMLVSGIPKCHWAVLTEFLASSIAGSMPGHRGCSCIRIGFFTQLWSIYAGRERRVEDVRTCTQGESDKGPIGERACY